MKDRGAKAKAPPCPPGSYTTEFIDYFTDIPLQLVNKINPTHFIASFYLKDRSPNTFFMGPIVDKDIESAIGNLKNSNVV